MYKESSPVFDTRDYLKGVLKPPPGVQPNFVNQKSHIDLIYAASAICIIVTTLSMLSRMYTKLYLMNIRGWEDLILFLSWVLALTYFSLVPQGAKRRLGLHLWNVTPDDFSLFLERVNVCSILYDLATSLMKLTIIVLLCRVFTIRRDSFWNFLFVLGIFTGIFFLSLVMTRIFACTPREKIWHRKIPGTCLNDKVIILIGGVGNAVFDIVLLMVPIFKVWSMQMERMKKVKVMTLFGTGFFGCVASVIRTVASVALLRNQDTTYYMMAVSMWCQAEIATGIVCCCLPFMPHLYHVHISRYIKSLRSLLFKASPRIVGSSSSVLTIGRGGGGRVRMDEIDTAYFIKPKTEIIELEEGLVRPNNSLGSKAEGESTLEGELEIELERITTAQISKADHSECIH